MLMQLKKQYKIFFKKKNFLLKEKKIETIHLLLK